MELEKMKTLWDEMSVEIENQKILTDKLIIDMTQERYRNKISKISNYESVGAIICFIMALVLITELTKLDKWYLLASGIFTVTYLVMIPSLVLRSIYKMKSINILGNDFKQVLTKYARRRKHFLFMQRLAIYLSFLSMIISLPAVTMIMNDKDLFVEGSSIWYWYLPMVTLFLIFFSRWGYGHYKNMTKTAGNLLHELEN